MHRLKTQTNIELYGRASSDRFGWLKRKGLPIDLTSSGGVDDRND